MDEEPGGLQSMGSQRVRHDWATHTHTHKSDTIEIIKGIDTEFRLEKVKDSEWETVIEIAHLIVGTLVPRHFDFIAPEWKRYISEKKEN